MAKQNSKASKKPKTVEKKTKETGVKKKDRTTKAIKEKPTVIVRKSLTLQR